MSGSSSEKQKKEQSIFAASERDAPFDVEHEWEESQFARFYLKHTNQQSNVYFEQYQREQAAQGPQWQRVAAPPPFSSRFSFLWRIALTGAFGVVVLTAVFGAAWRWSGSMQGVPAFADARAAYEDILSAQRSLAQFDLAQAMFLFHAAHERATEREQGGRAVVASMQGTLASFIHRGGGGASAGVSALEREALGAAEKLAQGMEPLFQVSFASFFRMKDVYAGATAGESIGDALVGIAEASSVSRRVEEVFAEAKDDAVLADDARTHIGALAPQLALAGAHAGRLASYLKLAVWALGVERPRKFVLVAQDGAVARATGGAIRSVGVITTQGGAITGIVFDDVYGVDGQLQVNVVPPEPIQKTATAWALHDANWFLDFPLSAKKIAYFYGKSGGGDADGVIALNDRALKNILALTGPVKGNDGVLVNSENRERLAHTDVLRAISEILPTFSGDTTRAFMQAMQEGLREKDILVWLAERDHQDMIVREGWGGEVISEEGADYLAVVSSDVGGAAVAVQEDVWKETHIEENGDIINTVAVQFVPKNGAGAEHERYMRIYVPAGSELLEASGIAAATILPQIDYAEERFIIDEDLAVSERATRNDASGVRIFEESGKTVFGGWVAVGKKSVTAIVRYRLPFSFTQEASRTPMTFIFQKQPGVSAGVNFSLVAPEGMQAIDEIGRDLSAISMDGTTDVIIRATIK
ncbi:DUF4012 domain-containing protein [Candidatus Azambacteria bacterium]|nr:DUF4012 domain-containing protein [Candidatus Azambacteria bacterium]